MSERNLNGRSGNGRFAAGNPGGPGRPPRATEAEYMEALAETVSVATWRCIISKAATDALAGDSKAREWLSRYLISDQPRDLRLEVCDGVAITKLRQELLHEPEFLAYLEARHDPTRTTGRN